jgi:hypothetical protein
LAPEGPLETAAPPAPIFKISLGNATLLSVSYLVIATLNDIARRVFNWRFTEVVSDHLEEFPARTLRWAHLWRPLKDAYVQELIGPLGVRLSLGLTMVVLIYALAMFVGALMWLVRFVYLKVQAHGPGPA